MVTLPLYDQRWVARSEEGFRARSGSLCLPCGANTTCPIRSDNTRTCNVYSPVIAFKEMTGLNRLSNTFRRGPGWFRRLKPRDRVRLFLSDEEEFLGRSMVMETHVGSLGSLLENHAAMNHTIIDQNAADAETRLLKVLIKLYGKNYSMPDQIYSVIYLQPG